jgi:hypothetical protein
VLNFLDRNLSRDQTTVGCRAEDRLGLQVEDRKGPRGENKPDRRVQTKQITGHSIVFKAHNRSGGKTHKKSGRQAKNRFGSQEEDGQDVRPERIRSLGRGTDQVTRQGTSRDVRP